MNDRLREEWRAVYCAAMVVLSIMLAFVADSVMLKVVLILALLGIAAFFANRFFVLGMKHGEQIARDEIAHQEKNSQSDVWVVMDLRPGFSGHEIVTLKREPGSSPLGPSNLRKCKHSRVSLTPTITGAHYETRH